MKARQFPSLFRHGFPAAGYRGGNSPCRRPARWPLSGLGAPLCAGAAAAWLWADKALAGGFAAPIIEVPPAPPALTAGPAANWWLALLPLLLVGLIGRGHKGRDNGLTPLPPDHGGPCFGEGTFILLERGWMPVETIRTGDRIATSRGVQTVLAVDCWCPLSYVDRPALVKGVRLSPNHGVEDGPMLVPAAAVAQERGRIDGRLYIHVLVEDHAWLYARADAAGEIIRAESLRLSADLRLARDFPDLVARHAADPVAPMRVQSQRPGRQAA
ncbi:hypothetical protein B0A89_00720 [Paracoccus contaminans]|uniref:Hedgehog/Intein (Hint) domain-containing protein n=1 Tax=Paracoccus contaminans TaxID=1945662 RepID=A0A1W6CU39_9RHOB|nr:hypothetical protein B0A89_00720 [Paracoccus contaminans]